MAVKVWVSSEARPYADRAVRALTGAGVDAAPAFEEVGAEVRILLGTEAEAQRLLGADAPVGSERAAEPQAVEGIVVLPLPEPRDGLVGADGPTTLADLDPADRIAVLGHLGSEMLGVLRPDLTAVVFEGADDAKAALERGEVHAWIAPVRALRALGLGDEIGEVFEPTAWATEPGRGALVIDARAAGHPERAAVEALDDRGARAATWVEHRVPLLLGLPRGAALGVVARPHGPLLRVRALVPAAEGRRLVRAEVSGPLEDPESAARRTADQLRERGALLLWAEVAGR